jgi:2-(1,2-epoxy-1,2-dihydrophenyl)acetyl-CoA isomerase
MADVEYDVADGVATITLNRPESMNTMGGELLPLTNAYLGTAAGDGDVRVVVLTGTGRAFCAGGDLRDMASGNRGAPGGSIGPRSVARAIDDLRHHMRSSQLLREMPKVTIAAINGACAGAGFSWACACDLRYAADSAVFNTAFLTAGLSGDFGGTWTLPRIVGAAKARELYLMPQKFDSAEALRIGLVSEVVPQDDFADFVLEKAHRAAAFAPLTAASIKANLNDADHVSFSEALDREADRHIRSGLTEDSREAARAFLEKRAPTFTGR